MASWSNLLGVALLGLCFAACEGATAEPGDDGGNGDSGAGEPTAPRGGCEPKDRVGGFEAAHEEAYSCTIERYDGDRFRGWGAPESEMEIWVPVRARE